MDGRDRPWRAGAVILALGLAGVTGVAGMPAAPAFAAESLTITVRPSPPPATEAEAAAERIRRRLERTDTALRSICTGCGSAPREPGSAQAGGPPGGSPARTVAGGTFSPVDTLQGRAKAADRTLVETRTVVEVEVEAEVTPPSAGPVDAARR